MHKIDAYRSELAVISDWLPYLARNSNLPGPRGNLELVAACGEEADEERADELLATGDEFDTVCGLVALGRALALLKKVTDDLAASPSERRRDPAVRTLRQALGYAWSVAIASLPEEGLPVFRLLESSSDRDVAWICRENRKKSRFKRLLAAGDARSGREDATP